MNELTQDAKFQEGEITRKHNKENCYRCTGLIVTSLFEV